MGSLRPVLFSNSELAAMYQAGMTLTELSIRAKTSTAIVRACLLEMGTPMRSVAEVMALRRQTRDERRARIARRMGRG